MSQKYDLGITAQYIIAKKFNLEVSETVLNKVKSSIDLENYDELVKIVDCIFDSTTIQLVKCTALSKNYIKIPYQFISSDGRTISVRCNKSSDKIAVRHLGQAGKKVINDEFGHIFGKELLCANDYKCLFMENSIEILPMFVEAFFDADIIIWIYKDSKTKKFKYHYIDGNAELNFEFNKSSITHTQTLATWNNSNTIKYNGESLAEIQVFRDEESRNWIFRFYAGVLFKYIEKSNANNETLGATAERTICDLFNLKWKKEDNLDLRYDVMLAGHIIDPITYVFSSPDGLPAAVEYVGSKAGIRKGSKSPFDFILKGNKTLSVKTNFTGNKVCPPEIGQPNAETCYYYFKDFIEEDHIDPIIFKKMVYNNICEMLSMYMEFLFDSDFLLRIYPSKRYTFPFDIEIYKKGYGHWFKWDKKYITFTKPYIDDWHNSNTVKYDGITIGEFQVHNTRNCYMFRFDIEGLKIIVNKKRLYVE